MKYSVMIGVVDRRRIIVQTLLDFAMYFCRLEVTDILMQMSEATLEQEWGREDSAMS